MRAEILMQIKDHLDEIRQNGGDPTHAYIAGETNKFHVKLFGIDIYSHGFVPEGLCFIVDSKTVLPGISN